MATHAEAFAQKIGLPNMTPEAALKLRADVMAAFVKELKVGNSRWSSEHDGVLNLGIDEREDFKCLHIKPLIPDYDKFRIEYEKDLNCDPNTDQHFLENFFAKTEEVMRAVERYVRDEVVEFLNQASCSF